MNNNYDREETPKTYDEMVAAGYEMTGDGFWVPNDGTNTVEITEETTKPAVKLLQLLSGETVMSELTETMYGSEYRLNDPRTVIIQSTGDGETTIAYSDWMPLSNTRVFDVAKSYVVCVTDPLESLVESYLQNKNG